MFNMIKAKVYGTIKGEKRIHRKGHYYSVTRDKKGHFKTIRKWSPKKPNRKPEYKEKYIEAKKGKEVKEKVIEAIEEDQWSEFNVESP